MPGSTFRRPYCEIITPGTSRVPLVLEGGSRRRADEHLVGCPRRRRTGGCSCALVLHRSIIASPCRARLFIVIDVHGDGLFASSRRRGALDRRIWPCGHFADRSCAVMCGVPSFSSYVSWPDGRTARTSSFVALTRSRRRAPSFFFSAVGATFFLGGGGGSLGGPSQPWPAAHSWGSEPRMPRAEADQRWIGSGVKFEPYVRLRGRIVPRRV
jgi:hypothetical protein